MIPIFGLLGSIVTGLFGIGQSKAELAGKTIDLINSIQSEEAKAKVAAMAAVTAEYQSDSWITRTWRPLACVMFLFMLFAYFFGWAPSGLLVDKLPPMVERIFSILEVVILAGYPARTVEKVVRELSLGRIIQQVLEKKFL